MLKITKNFYLRSLALAGAIALANPSSLTPVRAEAESESLQSIPLEWNHNSPDFSEDGRPKRTAGGASRGECQKSDLPLTALIPNLPVALTAANSPTFWFYLPYTLRPEHSIEFVLKDSQDKYIYRTKLTGKNTSPGIVGLNLPAKVNIEPEQNYNWYFVVYCQPRNSDKFVYVSGSLQRIDRPHLNSSLKFSSPKERLYFYATEGLWYDAVTNLAKQIKANPQDNVIQKDWETLLKSVGLEEELASKPFVACCSLKE